VKTGRGAISYSEQLRFKLRLSFYKAKSADTRMSESITDSKAIDTTVTAEQLLVALEAGDDHELLLPSTR